MVPARCGGSHGQQTAFRDERAKEAFLYLSRVDLWHLPWCPTEGLGAWFVPSDGLHRGALFPRKLSASLVPPGLLPSGPQLACCRRSYYCSPSNTECALAAGERYPWVWLCQIR